MITTLYGFKKNQTRMFTEDGIQIYITNVVVDPCVVTRVVGNEKNRYQLGIGIAKNIDKPTEGLLKKAGIERKPRFFREVEAVGESDVLKPGAEIRVSDVFTAGDCIEITGISKGKGFASGIRRYHFSGGPKTHGQGDHWRSPGSIGAGTTPGRVYKGKRMAGRMGNDTVTVKGLRIVAVNTETNIVTVSGPVPGAKNSLVRITKRG